jgi:NAD(P)-dependent dehydrogenase (short-subunit alcohol dehydrogenase family)
MVRRRTKGPRVSLKLDFTGKTAVVTGAASGIGLACAKAFAAAGANVVLADIEAEKNKAAALNVAADAPASAFAVAGDVSQEEDCKSLVRSAVERFGRIDVLVNNAGIVSAGTILDLSPENFDRVLSVNLRGPFLLTQLAAREMIAQKIKGAIVNISSLNGVLAIPNQAAYVTSKGGLQQLTKVSALGLAEHGIRVNAIGPGSIMTDLLKKVMTDDAVRKTVLSRTPLGRVGDVEEIAAIALFLASDLASYITGQTIYADGGRLALNYTVPVREE